MAGSRYLTRKRDGSQEDGRGSFPAVLAVKVIECYIKGFCDLIGVGDHAVPTLFEIFDSSPVKSRQLRELWDGQPFR